MHIGIRNAVGQLIPLEPDFGVEVAQIHPLVNPKELPNELVEACKYKLKKGAKTSNWLENTGGIGGELFGLEADALGYQRLKEAYEKAIRPYLKAVRKNRIYSVEEETRRNS